jgi:Fur family peroxide stress response transcriptional regulator
MNTLSKKEIVSREKIKELFSAKGISVTNQRLQIAQMAINSNLHPTAEEIYLGVKSFLPGLSLATVYNTLNLLADLGILIRINQNGEKSRFDGNRNPHCHFLDRESGEIYDILCEDIKVLLNRDIFHDLVIEKMNLMIVGKFKKNGD